MSETDAQNGLDFHFNVSIITLAHWSAFLKPVFQLAIFFSREQTKSESDWVMMSAVFVTSQSSCFFLCSRQQIRLVDNRLYAGQNLPFWG